MKADPPESMVPSMTNCPQFDVESNRAYAIQDLDDINKDTTYNFRSVDPRSQPLGREPKYRYGRQF
jgi:hypothetical protein